MSLAMLLVTGIVLQSPEPAPFGTEGHVDSAGVKIHYVSLGEGPLVVMIHGFPDFWYSWRDQMQALSRHFQVVAIDQRGYNASDKPAGVENYTIDKLVDDVLAVVERVPRKGKSTQGNKAIVVGHDWGGMVAWSFAMKHPERIDRLVIVNLPHPRGLIRELANNPEQRKNSQYARDFQKPGAYKLLTPEALTFWVKEPEAKQRYLAAFKASSLEAMLNYYQANYPREPYADVEFPKVKSPVLMLHGLKDQYLLPGALNDNWKWVENEFTLVTFPNAGHFVHRDDPAGVNRALLRWLLPAPE
jgi:pimeloyl-ACP methyl ester carboxylesterase